MCVFVFFVVSIVTITLEEGAMSVISCAGGGEHVPSVGRKDIWLVDPGAFSVILMFCEISDRPPNPVMFQLLAVGVSSL